MIKGLKEALKAMQDFWYSEGGFAFFIIVISTICIGALSVYLILNGI